MADANTNSPAFVNVAPVTVSGGFSIETNKPNWPSYYTGSFVVNGTQTTPGLARGAMINTGVASANKNLTHTCDFNFIFKTGISLTGLANPFASIQTSIKNGKLAGAALTRIALNLLQKEFQAALALITAALNLDITGQLSLSISVAQSILISINELIKQVAEIAFYVSLVNTLYTQLNQIVAWIQSLPDQVKALLQNCLSNFKSSIQTSVDSLKSAADINQILSATLAASNTTAAVQDTSNSTMNAIINGASDATTLSNFASHVSSSIATGATSISSKLATSTSP